MTGAAISPRRSQEGNTMSSKELAERLDIIVRELDEGLPQDETAKAALRAAASALRGMEWQTIDSAPKDGRALLLVSGGWITVGSWHRQAGCWVTSGPIYQRYPADEQPDHWLPLPSPPTQDGEK